MNRLAILSALLFAAGCDPPGKEQRLLTFNGETMGTTYSVKVVDLPESHDETKIAASLENELDRLEDLMSTYREDSELSRLNRDTSGEWFDVSQDTAKVISAAIEIGEATEGAFDVTVNPLIALWNFGPTKQATPSLPTEEAIAAAMRNVGFSTLDIRDEPPAVRKENIGATIDLSAIAKGYAVDALANLLDEAGVRNYMVEVGGEVRTAGNNNFGKPWSIGIEAPIAGERRLQRAVPISGVAMATSGDYRNHYEIDGKRYSHLIDPRIGRPVEHALVSVSVVDESCARADAWATGLLVLGPQAGYQVAVENELAVLFITKTDAGLEERSTPLFAQKYMKR
jgi:thiamine biosynthesis lipoprotein